MMKIISVALVTLLLSLSAFAGDYENGFVDRNLLSRKEKTAITAYKDRFLLSEAAGSMAVIFPDDTRPAVGKELEKLVLDGTVRIVTFSGLPNTLLGSLSVGKLVAMTNHQPVLAVHTGYGDAGVFSYGPVIFYSYREFNRDLEKAFDPALTNIFLLLKKVPPEYEGSITLVGYCLGALKAANLAMWLFEENPSLKGKLDLIGLGNSVYLPTGFGRVMQVMGNLDQFGRINATDPLSSFIVPGQAHSVRLDDPTHLVIPSVEAAFSGAYDNPEPLDEEAVSKIPESKLEAQEKAFLRRSEQYAGMLEEVKPISAGGITDKIHDLLLSRHRDVEKSNALLAARQQLQFKMSDVQRKLNQEQDPAKRNELLQQIRKIKAQMRELKADSDDLLAASAQAWDKARRMNTTKRSSTTDLGEYNVWKAKGALDDSGGSTGR